MQWLGLERRCRLLVSVVLAISIAWPSAHALAQDLNAPSAAHSKLARSLYYDGLDLMDRGDWAEAADRLQRALELRDSAVVSYHLAYALSHVGRLVDAQQLLKRVTSDPQANADVRAAAATLLPEVERSIGRLTLRVNGELEGVRILINGRDTPFVALDVPVPVDPGEVRVVALRDEQQVAGTDAQIGGEAPLELELWLQIPPRPQPAPAPLAAPAPSLVVVPPPSRPQSDVLAQRDPMPRDDDGPGIFGAWWFWTAVGVVAAGTVVTTLALTAEGEKADLGRVRGDFEPTLLEGSVE